MSRKHFTTFIHDLLYASVLQRGVNRGYSFTGFHFRSQNTVLKGFWTNEQKVLTVSWVKHAWNVFLGGSCVNRVSKLCKCWLNTAKECVRMQFHKIKEIRIFVRRLTDINCLDGGFGFISCCINKIRFYLN